jgi:hypothetical protein
MPEWYIVLQVSKWTNTTSFCPDGVVKSPLHSLTPFLYRSCTGNSFIFRIMARTGNAALALDLSFPIRQLIPAVPTVPGA